MGIRLAAALVIIAALAALYAAMHMDLSSQINGSLNAIVAGEPDRSCRQDSDCALRQTSCSLCDCGDAVNMKWERFCPLPDKETVYCKPCASLGADFQLKCADGTCQKTGMAYVIPERTR
jgi:hypothetical protein